MAEASWCLFLFQRFFVLFHRISPGDRYVVVIVMMQVAGATARQMTACPKIEFETNRLCECNKAKDEVRDVTAIVEQVAKALQCPC